MFLPNTCPRLPLQSTYAQTHNTTFNLQYQRRGTLLIHGCSTESPYESDLTLGEWKEVHRVMKEGNEWNWWRGMYEQYSIFHILSWRECASEWVGVRRIQRASQWVSESVPKERVSDWEKKESEIWDWEKWVSKPANEIESESIDRLVNDGWNDWVREWVNLRVSWWISQ